MSSEIFQQLDFQLGANDLPYKLPIHPNLVHFTLGLFIIAILFDLMGMLFPIEQPLFKFFAITAIRSGFFDVGWYNLIAAAIITFFTVAAGFFELFLANPPINVKSPWGLNASQTMLLHGLGGILLLAAIVGMTVWRGFQRYKWRKNQPRQVQWSYLLFGLLMFVLLYLHGTLGAHLGDDFAIHNTAAGLLRQGKNPNLMLR